MKHHYLTKRLSINRIRSEDSTFFAELVNTRGWLAFIGDRNIRSDDDARAYIQRISDSPNVNYWVVCLQESNSPIGMVTFIKREYLEHFDIGFAFLPDHANNGYAYEASMAVLQDVINDPGHSVILATTVKDNRSSIKLLEKLGLTFEKQIHNGNDILSVYSVSVDKLQLNALTSAFYSLFTNSKQRIPVLGNIHNLCYAKASIIKKSSDKEEFFFLQAFIEPRKIILSDGTLTEFEEYEVSEETKIAGNLAQRYSKYRKSGLLNGAHFQGGGTKLFQFIKSVEGWKINSVIWEDDDV